MPSTVSTADFVGSKMSLEQLGVKTMRSVGPFSFQLSTSEKLGVYPFKVYYPSPTAATLVEKNSKPSLCSVTMATSSRQRNG